MDQRPKCKRVKTIKLLEKLICKQIQGNCSLWAGVSGTHSAKGTRVNPTQCICFNF